jgi:hypothetical protein
LFPGLGGRDVVVTNRAEFGMILSNAFITESLPPPDGEEMTTKRPFAIKIIKDK